MTSTTQPRNSADHLPCNGVWGGNKNARHDIRTSGLTVSVYSSASDGTEGGDICYVAVCKPEAWGRLPEGASHLQCSWRSTSEEGGKSLTFLVDAPH